MNKRITKLSESPCYKCGKIDRCEDIIYTNPQFKCIVDSMFGYADKDYHDCGIWIALNINDNNT